MSLAKLVIYKLRIALYGLTRGRASRRVARAIGAGGLAVAMVLFVTATYAVFAALAKLGPAGTAASGVIVTLAFNAILVIALVFDIATTTSIFFLSSDLDLLMASPLPTTKVFAVKYLEAMVSASIVAALVGIPILFGFGLGFHAPVVFFVAVIVVTAVFMTIPVSLGTMCGMAISRFVPANRVREVLAVLSGAIGIGIWIAIQALKPAMAQTGDIQNFGLKMQALSRGGAGAVFGMLPSRFPATVLTSLAVKKPLEALPSLVYLVAISGAMLAVSLVVAQRLYLTGWTRTAPSARRVKRVKRTGAPSRLWRLVPPTEGSVLRTTAHLFLRDPQQIMPVATLTIMMGLLPFFMGRSGQLIGLRPGTLLFSTTTLAFIGSMNLAMSAVAIDGRAFWWLLAAPRTSLRKLWPKMLTAMAFFVPLTWLLLAGFAAGKLISWPVALKAAWLGTWSSSLGAGVGVAMGITFADWEWDIPKRMIKTGGRLLLVGIGVVYFVAAGYALKFFLLGGRATAPPEVSWGLLAAFAAVSAAAAFSALYLSSRKMDRMEWPF